MLLRAHAIPAPPKTPASAAPSASNARPMPEILALRVAVGFQVVVGSAEAVGGNTEVVVAQVEGVCAVVAEEEGDADD